MIHIHVAILRKVANPMEVPDMLTCCIKLVDVGRFVMFEIESFQELQAMTLQEHRQWASSLSCPQRKTPRSCATWRFSTQVVSDGPEQGPSIGYSDLVPGKSHMNWGSEQKFNVCRI